MVASIEVHLDPSQIKNLLGTEVHHKQGFNRDDGLLNFQHPGNQPTLILCRRLKTRLIEKLLKAGVYQE